MNPLRSLRPALAAALLAALAATSGCAANGNSVRTAPETDPWEPTNRSIYAINDTVDRYTLKPIARGYRTVVPSVVRTGVSNFSNNLSTPASAFNNLLQGKPIRSLSDVTRFVINTTIGIGGLFDPAAAGGLERYNEDFGQTLAVWGVPDGPFVVLPIVGPSTLRDAVAFPVNWVTDVQFWIDESSVRDKINGLRLVDLRHRLLPADRFLEESKDPYVTLRESYLQNRRFEIYDGDPPVDDDFYEDFDDFEDFDDDLEDTPDDEASPAP